MKNPIFKKKFILNNKTIIIKMLQYAKIQEHKQKKPNK